MSHFVERMVADVEALSTAEYPAVKESCSGPALSKITYISKTFVAYLEALMVAVSNFKMTGSRIRLHQGLEGVQQARLPVVRPVHCMQGVASSWCGTSSSLQAAAPERLSAAAPPRHRRGSEDERVDGGLGGLRGKEWGFLMRKAKPLPCLVTNESI